MILGVDLGTYSVKTSTKVSFFSKISEIETFDDVNKTCINGEIYYIGEGEFSTDWNKAHKDNTIPLLLTAVYRSTEDRVNKVVLGLPIKQYKRNRDSLKELVRENRYNNINNRDIVISDVEVLPEGAAVYYNIESSMLDTISRQQLTIVCIGGRTTEVCQYKKDKIVGYDSYNVGMLNIYQDIVSYINKEYTKEFKLEEGQEILEEGLTLDGKVIDTSFITPILKRYFNSIYKDLQLKFNIDKGYIYLTGGGSETFEIAFKNRSRNIIKSKTAIWDNTLGYAEFGRSLWQR